MERTSEYSVKAPCLYTALQIDSHDTPCSAGRTPALSQIATLSNSTRSLTDRDSHPPGGTIRRKSVSGSSASLCPLGGSSVVKIVAFIGLMLVGIGAGFSLFAPHSQHYAINTESHPMITEGAILATRLGREQRAVDNLLRGARSHVYRDNDNLDQKRSTGRSPNTYQPYSFGLG